MNPYAQALVAFLGGIAALAMVSVIVSRRAQTPAVLQASGSALSSIIGAAVSPVTGQAGAGYGAAPSAVLGSAANAIYNA